MKTLLKLTLALALIAAAGWYWYSPRAAVEGLREAARAGDTAQLERRIELESVRENLKTDLKAHLAERLDREESGPLGALGLAVGTMFVDGLVDALVSPGGLALLARGRVPQDGATRPSSTHDDDYEIDREGFDRFLVRFATDDVDGPRPVLEFARRGLGWKLVRVVIPGVTTPATSSG